jgi:hypothetical protein
LFQPKKEGCLALLERLCCLVLKELPLWEGTRA